MTVAAWCVLVVLLAPYFLSVAAWSAARRADCVDVCIICVIALFVVASVHGHG